MSIETQPLTPEQRAEQDRAENQIAAQIFLGLAIFVAVAIVLVMLGGAPMLGIIGLVGTVAVFVVLLGFTAAGS